MAAPFDAPRDFLETLKSEHADLLRLRWSDAEKLWHIERKVGRQKSPHRKVERLDDRAIRWSDGYEFLLGVTAGDRHPCPRCGDTVKVPICEMKWARCPRCERDFRACYYPLGGALLEHLRYTSPERGGIERVFQDVERESELQEFRKQRRVRGDRKDAIWDDWRTLLNIQSVGYTGKEFRK